MHLKYDYRKAHDVGETRHAQVVMKILGINYQHSTPQSINDTFWFWGCGDLDLDNLPCYIKELKVDPMEWIGYALSREEAEKISAFEKQNE